MSASTEYSLLQALEAVSSAVAIRRASKLYGIPRSTIQDRLNGATSRSNANKSNRRLSRAQEARIKDCVLAQDALRLSPTHLQVRKFAERALLVTGDTQPLGKRWIDGFIRHNPEIKFLRVKSIESSRINGATTERIQEFFKLLALLIIQAIKPEDRWNMDETGMMEGLGTNGLVLGSSEKTMTIKKHPGSRSWTTIVECISATGVALTPLVIFKGESLQHQWFDHEMDFLKDWNLTASTKGWTDNEIALKWLKEVFIPQSEPLSPGAKRLLILDGHGSHTTDEFFTECYDHDIYVLFLPAHSSHVLQPPDVAIFSPLKQYYRAELALFDHLYESAPIAKMNFLYCYGKARQKALIKKNIISGFKTTGLWPTNASKALLNRFVTSRPRTPPKEVPTTLIDQSRDTLKTPRRASQVRSLFTARKALF